MIELFLKEEDFFASISEGGPSCITGSLNQSPLVSLLESATIVKDKINWARFLSFPWYQRHNRSIINVLWYNYVIRALDTAKIQLDGTKPFESPVILLHNVQTGQAAVCIRKEGGFGIIEYQLYTYSVE